MSDISVPSDQPQSPSSPTLEHTGLGDTELQKIHAQLAREKSEPTESYAATPLFVVFLVAMLSFWAGLYLIKYSGGFSPFVYDEHQTEQQETGSASVSGFDPMVAGKRFYSKNCVVCHQADGSGVAGQFPPLKGSDWVQGPEERLAKILLHGMSGEVRVNGNTYNGNMPAFGATAKDRDIAAVLTYLRTAPEFGNNSSPISEEVIKTVRTNFTRSTPWNGGELEALYGKATPSP